MSGTIVMRDFSANNSITWTPSYKKTYELKVIARDAKGVDPTAEVTSGITTITIKPALTAVSLAVSTTSPTITGKTVTMTATAINGARVQYKFLSGDTILSDFSDNNIFTWDPTAGNHSLKVIARDINSPDPNVTFSSAVYELTVMPALSAVSLSTLPANTAAFGNPVTLTAATTGGISVQYKFMNGTIVMRDFNSSNSFTWTPAYKKSYFLTVIARYNGSGYPTETVTSPATEIIITP
jgi:membrane carboxypeptidase/penicillin-binding protein PbpC